MKKFAIDPSGDRSIVVENCKENNMVQNGEGTIRR